LILDEPTSGLDLLTRREFLSSMVDMAGVGRTIFICSHQIAEVERVASHIAIMAEGRLLLAEPIDDLKKRFVRVSLRHEGVAPDPLGLGTLLERKSTGRFVQFAIRDPSRDALDALHVMPGVFDVEETTMSLEEIYTSILARPGKPVRLSDLAEAEAPVGQED